MRRILRRSFLKLAGAAFGAVLGLFPAFASKPSGTVFVSDEITEWQILVPAPAHGEWGAVIEAGFADRTGAEIKARTHADGGPYLVLPVRKGERGMWNGVPAHLHPMTAHLCKTEAAS